MDLGGSEDLGTRLARSQATIRLLQEIIRSSATPSGVEGLLSLLLHLVIPVSGAASAALLEVDPEARVVLRWAAAGQAGRPTPPPSFWEGGSWSVAGTGELWLPLRIGNRLQGALCLGRRRDGGAWAPGEIDLLLPAAEGIAIALENARLLAESAKQVERLTALRDLSLLAASTVPLDDLLRGLIRRIVQVTGVRRCVVNLLQPENGALRLQVGYDGLRPDPWIGGIDLSLERYPEVAEGIRTRRPVLIRDVGQDPLLGAVGEALARRKVAAMLVVPLIAKDAVIGVIALGHLVGEGSFSAEDIEFCQILAAQAAITIDNARLFAETRNKVTQLSSLMELSAILNSSLETREVRRRAMEAGKRLMGCETGSLLFVDEGAQELYFDTALGEKGEEVKQIRLKMGQGIAGWVAQHGEPALVNDFATDPRAFRGADEKTRFVTRNMICVPCWSRGKVIGVLQAINRLRPEPFGQADLELLTALANQVAIAVENARLYEEVRETFISTAEALSGAIEKRDPYTGGHTRRVHDYCMAIAKHLTLTLRQVDELRLAAILHDVGKIGIDDAILRKTEPLDRREFFIMKRHPEIGVQILGRVKQLKAILPGIRSHQERYDGKGYPDGLRGGRIPLIARIIAVADTFDAMTTNRPYRKRLSDQEALAELERSAGRQFDAEVVQAFLRAYEEGEIRLGRKRRLAQKAGGG